MRDQLNRLVDISDTPNRIISLVPSQTELLCYLGLEAQLVGITKFCVRPKHLRSITIIVGGTKTVHIDKIKNLKPDIILCNKEENTRDMISELEKIAPVHISDVYTIEDSLELISMYGELFDRNESAKNLIYDIRSARQDFSDHIQDRPKQKIAYFIWKNPYMVAGSSTFINAMLECNHFENVFQDLDRYPEVTLEMLQHKKPDHILLSSEPFPFKDKDVNELQMHFPDSKIHIVDGEAFSWYGSRLLYSFEYFRTLDQKISKY